MSLEGDARQDSTEPYSAHSLVVERPLDWGRRPVRRSPVALRLRAKPGPSRGEKISVQLSNAWKPAQKHSTLLGTASWFRLVAMLPPGIAIALEAMDLSIQSLMYATQSSTTLCAFQDEGGPWCSLGKGVESGCRYRNSVGLAGVRVRWKRRGKATTDPHHLLTSQILHTGNSWRCCGDCHRTI